MRLSYNIQTAAVDTTDARLYLEINPRGLSYIIMTGEACQALCVYDFEEGISDEQVAENIHQLMVEQPVLYHHFSKTNIIYGYSNFVLVPEELMAQVNTEAMLELIYGDASEKAAHTDFMPAQALHNVYEIPPVVELVITRYFSTAAYSHLFSLLPNIMQAEGDHLYCIFGNGDLRVMLMKEKRLQVMQTYAYEKSDDVAYYLLNLCASFEAGADQVRIHLAGMIAENALLYRELYKYFLHLELEPLPSQYEYPEEMQQYPAHYFSHLFQLSACV